MARIRDRVVRLVGNEERLYLNDAWFSRAVDHLADEEMASRDILAEVGAVLALVCKDRARLLDDVVRYRAIYGALPQGPSAPATEYQSRQEKRR